MLHVGMWEVTAEEYGSLRMFSSGTDPGGGCGAPGKDYFVDCSLGTRLSH